MNISKMLIFAYNNDRKLYTPLQHCKDVLHV